MGMKFAKKNTTQEIIDKYWKVLIVDDEAEVHNITKSVLEDLVFDGKKLQFLSAYSGEEAIEILKKEQDIALIFLDVVMESDDAGLKVAKKIRNELGIKKSRIILRTGQPGMAPEKEIIKNYDINDYKEKTELTSTRLYTTVISALRAYRDIVVIEYSKIGLQKIIDASKSIFKLNSLMLFIEGVLTQLVSIFNLNNSLEELRASDAFFATLKGGKFELLATAGKFKDQDRGNIITPKSIELLNKAYENKMSFFEKDSYVGYFESSDKKFIFLYLEGCEDLGEMDKEFLKIFSNNISIAFENVCLNDEIINTQKELIERLGEVVENRHKESAHHVNRVAIVSYILARAYGLSEEESCKIKLASPMHDIGKIAIPDSILLKPDVLSDKEFEVMKTHSQIGKDILSNSKRALLKRAEIIAYEHHERWDGTGYPRGLKGEEIDICGRITAIADVFDALTHERVYKSAWKLEDVLDYIKEQRGKHFEPKLVDLFFENFDAIQGAIENPKSSLYC